MTVPLPRRFRLSRTRRRSGAAAAGDRGVPLLEGEPLERERPRGRESELAFGRIEVEDVSFRYPGRARPALARVSLRAEPGETLQVEGLSSAARSTLARLLVRLYDPDAGAVRLDGVDLRRLAPETVQANIGSLRPEQPLSDTTLWENITRGCHGATRQQVVAAAGATGVDELAALRPEGCDAAVGPGGSALSREQRQRVRLARALLCDTPVVVLHDPFDGLDETEARRLLPALRALCRGRTAILISDHPLAHEIASRTVTASDGRSLTLEQPSDPA
jgi:ATP-binding cassette subfamily B protein